ncbi:putative 2OG-Fe(II) oxygenase [Actinosynnema sp. NPDC023587]|uniref:putative 2OG-Fe(II) oxygenase n=1 Tax=Actinosynnema sp. NPDC023587 TaxID=3154695 RepID=UPI0033F2B9F9
MTAVSDERASDEARPGTITRAFATPVARIGCPFGDQLNGPLTDLVLRRLGLVENKFSYKSETSADMASWCEPVVDSLTGWVLQTAREFVETVGGHPLSAVFTASRARDANTFNTAASDRVDLSSEEVTVAASRSWASVYRRGDQHPAHFHPNTAIAAIYYVHGPGSCELDLIDPRSNVDYFDPGILFAGEGQNIRLRCVPGELVLFPGWLKHSVPRFDGDGVRISLSWNLVYSLRSPQTG